MKMLGRWIVGAVVLASGVPANGDVFHHNNIIVGTRAVGLGGAFCAVADDASGVVYNPAGLAFALSADISGSANAFYQRKATYQKTIGTKDFEERSSGSVPSFFGGLQKLDNLSPGMAMAFGVYSTDSDLKDQNDLIDNDEARALGIERFHRTSNQRAATSQMAIALAKRFSSAFSVGLGVGYLSVDELVQEYQDAVTRATVVTADRQVSTDSRYADLIKMLNQNIRTRLTAAGVVPVLGMQMALGTRFALGLMVRYPFVLSQALEVGSERTISYVHGTNNAHLSTSEIDGDEASGVSGIPAKTNEGDSINTEARSCSSRVCRGIGDVKSTDPLGGWPAEYRVGLAWYASPRFMWTADGMYYSGSEGDQVAYNREPVFNFATGLEYYIVPSFPVRVGVFSNNDARPKVDPTKRGQPDHIDYLGESVFVSWVQPNSQISLGLVLQQGTGQAQKLGDAKVQEVVAQANTFSFSATHNF